MRCAGADGFLSGLLGSRKTHLHDLHICVEDQSSETKEHREGVDQSVEVAGCRSAAGQHCNVVIVAENSVNDVSTQLGGDIQ